MNSLHSLQCTACRADSPSVGDNEAERLLAEIPGWRIENHDGVPRLTVEYRFEDFRQAIAFANRVAALAEAEDHHPLLQVEWGRARVQWWTHRIQGLHLNDFIMAARTDRLVSP